MKNIVPVPLEDVLYKIVALAGEIIGLATTRISEPLAEMLIRNREEIDLSGGCGKLRLGVQYRGERLLGRLALSLEAVLGGCEPIAQRWAGEAYRAVAGLDPDAVMLVVAVDGNGKAVRQLWIVDKTGARAGI